MHYPNVAGLDFRQNAAANLRMCFIVEIGAGRHVVRPPILMLADQIEGGMGGVTGFLLGRAGRQDVGQDFILRCDEVDHRIVLRPERVRDIKLPMLTVMLMTDFSAFGKRAQSQTRGIRGPR